MSLLRRALHLRTFQELRHLNLGAAKGTIFLFHNLGPQVTLLIAYQNLIRASTNYVELDTSFWLPELAKVPRAAFKSQRTKCIFKIIGASNSNKGMSVTRREPLGVRIPEGPDTCKSKRTKCDPVRL